MAWVARYRWWVVAGSVVVLAVVTTLIVVVWPVPTPEAPRAREYRDYDVCLLTPAAGLADPVAAAVWAGAQEVSLARRVRVRYQVMSGEQTASRAGQYLASLVQQQCEVIVAVGPAPAAAAAADEARYSQVAMVAVGDEIDGSSGPATTKSTVDVLLGLVPVN